MSSICISCLTKIIQGTFVLQRMLDLLMLQIKLLKILNSLWLKAF